MFKKVVSLCLSAALVFSVGSTVANAEEQMGTGLCRYRCKELLENKMTIERFKRLEQVAVLRAAQLGRGPWPEWAKNPTDLMEILNYSMLFLPIERDELLRKLNDIKEVINCKKEETKTEEQDLKSKNCFCDRFRN